jgi:hypothetical protein
VIPKSKKTKSNRTKTPISSGIEFKIARTRLCKPREMRWGGGRREGGIPGLVDMLFKGRRTRKVRMMETLGMDGINETHLETEGKIGKSIWEDRPGKDDKKV